MPNSMPGNIAKGRFLAKMDARIAALPTEDLATGIDRNTLRAELAALDADQNPVNPLITRVEQQAPNCIVDRWLRPAYDLTSQVKVKRWHRDRRHVYRHWFPEPPWKNKLGNDPEPDESSLHGGWFEKHQPVARVVRQGLIAVLDLLNAEPNLEVDCYWLCAGSHFEVATMKSDVQLTVLFLTPSPPMTRRGRNFRAGFEDIYITKHKDLNPGEQIVDETIPDTVTVQLARPR